MPNQAFSEDREDHAMDRGSTGRWQTYSAPKISTGYISGGFNPIILQAEHQLGEGCSYRCSSLVPLKLGVIKQYVNTFVMTFNL